MAVLGNRHRRPQIETVAPELATPVRFAEGRREAIANQIRPRSGPGV